MVHQGTQGKQDMHTSHYHSTTLYFTTNDYILTNTLDNFEDSTMDYMSSQRTSGLDVCIFCWLDNVHEKPLRSLLTFTEEVVVRWFTSQKKNVHFDSSLLGAMFMCAESKIDIDDKFFNV